MSRFAYNSPICKQLFVLILSFWISAIKGANQSFDSTPSHISPTFGRLLPSRLNFAAARQSNDPSPDSAGDTLITKPNQKNQNFIQEDEAIPTWILVLVCVVIGFVVVACCLGAVKYYQWKKDQGTYSIWNDRELNVESLYARESGVIFEKLDVESSVYEEDQCYEIPVDSFITPQRVYIGGIRVTPVKEGISESMKSNERRMSESAKRMASVGEPEYFAVTDRINRGADITTKPDSTYGSVCGDISQRSSFSLSTRDSFPERVFTPTTESPANESYCKPLPVIGIGEPVTCETYELAPNKHRFIALVNRPLPQTPLFGSPSHVVDSWASLDRSLLKQQKENDLSKKVIFRTLPRPRKLRQLHAPKPLVNAISRSASSGDVNKEIRVNHHVAFDTRECTLTKIKKRLSQSLDTLLMTERASHFYENPDLMPSENNIKEEQESEGSDGTLGVMDVPTDKEHLYARISTVLDLSDGNLNRHSYASVHYPTRIPSPVFARPKSRHTYISIIFGSTEPVFESSANEPSTDCGIAKSHSCSDLSSIRRATTSDSDGPVRDEGTPLKNTYVNLADMAESGETFSPIKFSSPRSFTNEHEGSSSTDGPIPSTDAAREDNSNNNNLMSFFETKCPYVNVNEALEASCTESSTRHEDNTPCSDNDARKRGCHGDSSGNGDSSYLADNSGSTVEDRTELSERFSGRDSESSDLNESYYGVPKTPAIPLKRLNEILASPSGCENDGNIEVCSKVNGVKMNGLDKSAGNRPETLSRYLEGRFVQDLKLDGDAEMSETNPETEELGKERVYENYISRNGQNCAPSDQDSSSSSEHDKISLTSSLSVDEKENESQPLISRRADADVNGNSVGVRHVEKLELRGNSMAENAFSGESLA